MTLTSDEGDVDAFVRAPGVSSSHDAAGLRQGGLVICWCGVGCTALSLIVLLLSCPSAFGFQVHFHESWDW